MDDNELEVCSECGGTGKIFVEGIGPDDGRDVPCPVCHPKKVYDEPEQ